MRASSTDKLLTWCKANRIYLILDLHAAPGGQGRDADISDYDAAKPSLWESAANQQKTIALWRKLSGRYANEPWIGGYDLINEPNWIFEGKDKNGKEDLSNKPIWGLYQAITRAIREVDKNHIGWAWWPHKKVQSDSCILTVTRPEDFKKVVDYWNKRGERPSREIAANGFFELAENLKAANCRFNTPVAQALIPPDTTTR